MCSIITHFYNLHRKNPTNSTLFFSMEFAKMCDILVSIEHIHLTWHLTFSIKIIFAPTVWRYHSVSRKTVRRPDRFLRKIEFRVNLLSKNVSCEPNKIWAWLKILKLKMISIMTKAQNESSAMCDRRPCVPFWSVFYAFYYQLLFIAPKNPKTKNVKPFRRKRYSSRWYSLMFAIGLLVLFYYFYFRWNNGN